MGYLYGSAANADWTFDNFAGRLRFHSGGAEYFNFRVEGMEIGGAADPFNVAIGGAIATNTKLMMAGSVDGGAGHAFILHLGSVNIDPADTFNAYGLFGGGTVVATAAETVANTYSMFAALQVKTGAGDITNAYGLYVEDPTIGDVLNLGIYSEGTIEFVKQLYKGTNIDGSHITVNVASTGGVLASDNTGITIQLGVAAGGTDLNGQSVIAVSGNMVSRASGAGAIIGGEFAARMGANVAAYTGDMRGVYAHIEVEEAGAGKTIQNVYGILADMGYASIGAGYAITNAYSGYFATPNAAGLGTITNSWALYSEGVTRLVGLTEFPTSGAAAGLLIGGDALLYRVAADILRTPDSLIVDTALGIGVTAIPHNAVGWAKFEVKGNAASSAGPHIQTKLNTDDWPAFQFFSFTHDNLAINFDAYWQAGWKSSHVGSNFQIYKIGNALQFNYDSGIAGGAGLAWNVGMSLSVTGQLTLPQSGSGAGLIISDVQWYRAAANLMALGSGDNLQVDGVLTRVRKPIVAKSGAYTIIIDDEVIIADASGASFAITLPTAVGIPGKTYWIKKIDATANTVTVDADGTETIDDGLTAIIGTQYEAITVVSDGAEWWVI